MNQNEQYVTTLLEDGTVEITKHGVVEETLIVPEMLDGHRVTGIGDAAFESCRSLTSITIPDSVTSIGSKVFRKCAPQMTVIVARDSYAEQWCIDNNTNYTFPNANDWLLI